MTRIRVALWVVCAAIGLLLGLACDGGGQGGEPVDKPVCMDRHGFNTPCPNRK